MANTDIIEDKGPMMGISNDQDNYSDINAVLNNSLSSKKSALDPSQQKSNRININTKSTSFLGAPSQTGATNKTYKDNNQSSFQQSQQQQQQNPNYSQSHPFQAPKPTIKANHANGKFTCECTICLEQTKPEYHLDVYQNQLDVREHIYQQSGMPRDFHWFMIHLLPINEKIRGCELVFPDSVFFQRGKPKLIIKNDKEYCLMPIRQLSKLNLQAIYKDFSNVVRERKKDFIGPFHKIYGTGFSGLGTLLKNSQTFANLIGSGSNSNNDLESAGSKFATAKDFSEENLNREKYMRGTSGALPIQSIEGKASISKEPAGPITSSNQLPDKNIYFKDVALIRYRPDEKGESLVQVVNETGFMSTFQKRANDDYWKTVSCIQTNIKSRLGCGTPIIIKFYAPLDYEDPESEIQFDYKSIGQDEELLRKDLYQYCLKQCYKMCFYMQKVYNFEILKMRTEFTKDENGTIWFFYASQIIARPVKGKGQAFSTKKLNYVNQQNKTHLLQELERHQDQARENNSQNIQKMYEIMGTHYNNMKDQVGLRDVFDNSDSDEAQTEEIFKKLRPQSPYKFKDLIKNDFDPKKFNRMMGKADKKLDHEQVKDIILYNKPVHQQSKRPYDKESYAQLSDNARLMHNYIQPGQQQQQPFSSGRTLQNNTSVNQSSNRGYSGGRLLSFKQRPMTAPTYKSVQGRVAAGVGGIATASTNTNSNNLLFNQQNPGLRQKAFFQISRGLYHFDSHKNVINSNLSSSSLRDLHKMYEPPIPKHQIPTNNPFYNHQLAQNNTDQLSQTAQQEMMMHLSQKGRSSPRSLLNWINSPNTKRVQQKMANRIQYLKFLNRNKNAYMSDIAIVQQPAQQDQRTLTQGGSATIESNMQNKMGQLLMLADDPKAYFQAMEELKKEEEAKGNIKEDHLFEDKYIISDKTLGHHQNRYL